MLYLNGNKIDVTIFPDNTSQVWNVPDYYFESLENYITWEFSHEGEFMHLAQLTELIRTMSWDSDIHLDIKYLPYARQDKTVSNKTTFALRPFFELLGRLNFDAIRIQDPHSDPYRTSPLGMDPKPYYPKEKVEEVFSTVGANLVCYPDTGAAEKYSKVYDFIYIQGQKTRDQQTGYITDYILDDADIRGMKILIVDDICDGGMTFTLLAKALYKRGVEEVNLFVTHGIFSKGLKPLREAGIKRIFTAKGEAGEVQDHIVYKGEINE